MQRERGERHVIARAQLVEPASPLDLSRRRVMVVVGGPAQQAAVEHAGRRHLDLACRAQIQQGGAGRVIQRRVAAGDQQVVYLAVAGEVKRRRDALGANAELLARSRSEVRAAIAVSM